MPLRLIKEEQYVWMVKKYRTMDNRQDFVFVGSFHLAITRGGGLGKKPQKEGSGWRTGRAADAGGLERPGCGQRAVPGGTSTISQPPGNIHNERLSKLLRVLRRAEDGGRVERDSKFQGRPISLRQQLAGVF
jgi:hypothetical protein